MKESVRECLQADIEEEDESWRLRGLVCEHRRSLDFIGTIEQLWTLLSVKPPSVLIQRAVVVGRYRAFSQAQVAGRLPALLDKLEARVDVGFASGAAERSILEEIDQRDLCASLVVIILRRLRQWLDQDSEGYSARLLHLLVLRSAHRGGTHESRPCLAFVIAHAGHCRRWWEVWACCTILHGSTPPDCFFVEEAKRPW